MSEPINESQFGYGFVAELRKLLFGPDKDGTLWMGIGGSNPPFSNSVNYYLRSEYAHKLARWQSQFLYRTSPIATAGIDALVNLVLGQGLQYLCDADSEQRLLDEWIDENDWDCRSRETFCKTLTDGESFLQRFGKKVRAVSPDQIYDSQTQGIVTDPDDYETVLHYVVNRQNKEKINVPAKDMQHRKLSHRDEKRGIPILFPIAEQLVEATDMLESLNRTCNFLSRIGAVRESSAPQASVQSYLSDIQALPQNRKPPNVDNGREQENVEHYAPGSIITTANTIKWTFPAASMDAASYTEVYQVVVELCAARLGIPASVLSGSQKDMAAYTAALVADSHCVKSLEQWQQRCIRWDKQLFKMFGFDVKKINIVAPEIAIHDKKAQIELGNFLLDKKLASKQTVGKIFEIDYEAELPQIEEDVSKDSELMPDTENDDGSLNKGSNENK